MCATFGEWLFHLAVHSRWRRRLVRIGFLDAESEGGVLFWRWDYKNARRAAWIREHERKVSDAKAEATRARWGETAAGGPI